MAEQHNHLYLVDGSSLHFPRLSPAAAADQPPRRAGGRGLWLYGDAVEARRRPQQGRRADPHGGDPRQVVDAPSATQMYDQYKANRPPPPEDLIPQFPLIRTATRAFSIPCIETEGLEADDIIACYAKAALAAGWSTTIVSSDKDLMQLIEPGVDMLDTMNDRRIDADYVKAKFGVPPGQARRRARADGRQRRQCPGRARDRPQDRVAADQRIRRPRGGARRRPTASRSPS